MWQQLTETTPILIRLMTLGWGLSLPWHRAQHFINIAWMDSGEREERTRTGILIAKLY